MTFRYILRYKIDPAYYADERIDELAQFCIESHIDQVMLFMPAEELSLGHATRDQLQPYVDMGKRLKKVLSDHQVDLSLNPWTTTYHSFRGRRLQAGQDFRLMVGENASISPVAVCPLCENWQSYLCDLFGWLCRELQPVAMWVEDDWRLHNHGTELSWGGCFCDEHLKRFAEIVGEPVTREQVIANVLAGGKPHDWRDAWLDLSRQSLLEPAEKLRNACVPTRLGLMSSVPDIHSTEGRDWYLLQKALGDEPAFMTRPHMPPYTQTHAIAAVPSVTRHTIANLKRPLEIYPELENSPRCGPFSKSRAYTVWQCLHAAAFGSHGITINHYDMMGNGIALDLPFGGALADAKDQLDALAALRIDDADAHGVRVLFDPQVARYAHLEDAASFFDLDQCTWFWSDTFYILGVAHAFTCDIEPGEVHAVSGQTLRAFDDEKIDRLLREAVLFDAQSTAILFERGFGERIGVREAKWRTLNDTAYAYEQVIEPDVRMTAQRCAMRLLDMAPCDETDVRSWINQANHTRLWPGLIVHGNIACLTYPIDDQADFFMGYFNIFRRALMHNLLFELSPQAKLAVAEESPMHVYRAPTREGLLLGALNPLHDVADRLVWRLSMQVNDVRILTQSGQWADSPFRKDGSRLIVDTRVDPLCACFLLVR